MKINIFNFIRRDRLVLCAVCTSKNSNVHQLLMYNMKERERLEHRSADDHDAVIVDMTTSETLSICATSSLDKTIRVWNHKNRLVNILQINSCAWHVAFSSAMGDIIFSAGRHLFKIAFDNYLTPYYQAKLSTSHLSEEKCEQTVPEDLEYKIYNDQVDRNFMLHPVSSLPLASLDVSNSESPQTDPLVQEQFCDLIESRDQDIMKMKNYLAAPSKLAADRALMTTQVWAEYVNDLLSNMTRTGPDVPVYDYQSIVAITSKEKKAYNKPAVFKMLFGRSLDNLDDFKNSTELMKNSQLPLNGFLPNSILYKPEGSEIAQVFEEPVRKKLVKYKYPVEFLTKSKKNVSEEQVFTRISQLIIVESENDNQETA